MPANVPDSASLNCPKCNKPYEWRPEYVGRVAQCPCGHVMEVPPYPKTQRFTAPPPKPIPTPPPPPATPSPAAADGIPTALAMNPFLAVNKEEPLPEEVEREMEALGQYREARPGESDPFRDVKVPTGLLIAGLILMIGQMAFMSRNGVVLIVAIMILAVQLFINLVLMLGGVLLAARFAGIDFGPLNTALLKLCAIYLAPTVLGGIVTQALGGDLAVAMIGMGVSVVCYWALLSYLFRLDGSQTMICVMTIGGVRLATQMCILSTVAILVMKLMGAAGGSGAMPDMNLGDVGPLAE